MLGQVTGLKLAAANRRLIELIAARLGLRARFHAASELGIGADDADARLAQMVARLAPAGTYLSGRGGAKYQDPGRVCRRLASSLPTQIFVIRLIRNPAPVSPPA